MRPELLEAIGRFKEHDVDIYIVSSTYEFMVAPFAEAVGAIAGYGASLETEDGRCTGRLTGPLYHQQTKADLVRRLATERGYDLSGCWAFGDSVNDQAMLESVGHPVAICPSKGLRRVAVERGWQILDR